MLSEEVIEAFKNEIPKLKGICEHLGITHLDIEKPDGSLKQIVLLFERLQVVEPTTILRNNQKYADVYVKISDEVLVDIASKEINIDDAIKQKLFKVFGDAEIWKYQLNALKKILPNLTISKRKETLKQVEPTEEEDSEEFISIDFGSLPQMDLSDIPEEFLEIAKHFENLRYKYVTKK